MRRSHNYVDLTDKRFGRLTVREEHPERDKFGRIQYICDCDCGNTTITLGSYLSNGDTNSCGCLKKEWMSGFGQKKFNWKGGKTYTGAGYVEINLPNHPNSNKKGYVLEHRLIMSSYIGRPLTEEENVHHKNGIKDDNRIENLELWVKTQPCGQRVEDIIEFCVEQLNKYAPELLKEDVV